MLKLNKKIWKGLALVCLILGSNLRTFATTYTLNTSNAQIQWSDANAWQPNGVPGAGDDVIINGNESSNLITSGDITVKSLTINGLAYIFGPGTLTVTEMLDTRYPLFWQMRLVIAAGANATMTDVNFSNIYTGISFYNDLIVNGSLILEAQSFSGTKVIVNGTLTQKEGGLNAQIYINPGGVLNINSLNFPVDLGRLENKGTLNWIKGKIQSNGAAIINTGLWNIEASNEVLESGGFFQDTFLYNSGTIQIAPNVVGLSMIKKMINTGTINIAGPSTLSLFALDHYGSINGPAGSSLVVSGGYFSTNNTLRAGSTIQVPSFKTSNSAALAIKNGANISSVQNFFFDQGPLELDIALPPAATYTFRAGVVNNVNQNFTGNFLLEGGTFDGTGNISFDTPNFIANYGYFGGYTTVTLSANTILDLRSLGTYNLINDGTIIMQQNGYFTSVSMINNGTWNINGDSTNFLSNYDPGALVGCKNNGVINLNNRLSSFSTVLENIGTINIGNNSSLQFVGELRQFGTIAGQPGSKLSLISYAGEHTFNTGAQTSGLMELGMFYGKTNFKQGTTLTNISTFSVDEGTLQTGIVLPPASNYAFKKGLIRLNTQFEPTTVLNLEDTDIEGSGNIRIGNGLNWKGGIMDVPVRIYENAQVFIQENEDRPIISAPFTNEGNVTLSGGIIEINTGFFKNGGDWNVDSDEDVIMDGFTSFTNEGVFSICGNQPIKIAFNVPFINGQSGTFKGQGSYTFNAGFTNEGTVAPGCSPGILTIEDNLNAPAAVEIEVSGANIGQYDQLLVSGNMTAGALLNIVVPPGASLNGSIKVIQTAGTFSGTFAQVNLPANFTLQYLPDGVLLTSDGSVDATDIQQQASALSIRPTLASTSVVITAKQAIPNDAQLEVYNLGGQLVRSTAWLQGSTQQELNVEGLNNGLYTIRLTTLPYWSGRIVVQN